MLVYYFMVLLLFFIALVMSINKQRSLPLFLFLFVLFVLHDGLRWDTGTDWDNYYNYFQHCLYNRWEHFEVGYCILSELIREITDSYTVFLFVHAFIIWQLIFLVIWRFSPFPFLSVYLLYCLMLPLLGMNRQYIALALCVFSVIFIYRRKIIPFLLLIALAFTFHKSALCFIFTYFLFRKFSTKFYICLLVFVVVVSFTGVIDKIPIFQFVAGDELTSKQLSYYIGNTNSRTIFSSLLGIIRMLFWFALAFPLFVRTNDRKFILLFNIYFCYIIFYWLFNGSIFQIFVSRALVYFTIFEIFIIPFIYRELKYSTNRPILLIFLFIYTSMLLYKNITFYTIGNVNPFIPYKFFF